MRHFSGADIEVFTDAELALASIENQTPINPSESRTVILLDINMPLMNGWDFLDQFSELEKNLCKSYVIFMLSSSLDKDDLQRAEDNDLISGYLSKPLNFSYLKEVITYLNEDLNKFRFQLPVST